MDELRTFLKSYSFDDLAKTFFALNLWLPNIASPIKSQYLYTLLEEIAPELSKERKLLSYADFEIFAKKVIELTPSFPSIEDYVPEQDWGDIKYYHKKQFYKIFYGGDLSNPYEFYNSFEIIHKWFEDYYLQLVKRSAFSEFQLSLELQDFILENLKQEQLGEDVSLHSGDFSVPKEEFWNEVVRFIDAFEPEKMYDPSLVEQYTHDGEVASKPLTEEQFGNNAFEGKNCLYFFIKKDGKYYPVLPRRYFSVVLDDWGRILREKYLEIAKLEEAQGKKPEYGIYVALVGFLKKRFEENEVFEFASPVKAGMKAQGTVFAAIKSKDKLFMVYVTPPSVDRKILENHFKVITPQLKECKTLLETPPTQLALLTRNEGVQFVSKDGKNLTPHFIVVVPYCSTEITRYSIPKDLDATVIGLDQFVGLMEEMHDPDEMSDFFEYVEQIQGAARIPAITSYLDMFGSFRDSHSVLVPGAQEPDMIMLDFSWGSSTRFKTLKNFWRDFPENDFFGHPMSWLIPEERKTKNGFVMDSRTYFGFAYFQRVNNSVFYISAPVHLMKFQQGKVTDSLMHALADALDIHTEILGQLEFCKTSRKVQIMFFPASLVKESDELKHVTHLLQDEELWKMDITRISPRDYGVRVVFNEEKLLEALQDVKDRSLQISLLQDVLGQMSSIWPETNLKVVTDALEKEKSKPPRFKTAKVDLRVAFPELFKTLLPDSREYKLADKAVAQFAHDLGITPGTYKGDEAKEKIDSLIGKVVAEIDGRVSKYDLEKSLPLLLEKTDSLIAEYERGEAMAKISLEHEVDYERATWSSEKYKNFLGHYKSFRYLVEKFAQLRPGTESGFTEREFIEVVALVDRLLDLRSVSDFLHYDIYQPEVTINHDFLASINYGSEIDRTQDKFSEEQAKLQLGEIGIDSDAADIQIPIDEYLDELNQAFEKDFGFGYRDLINVQQILALWPSNKTDAKENYYYSATADEIADACTAGIKDFDRGQAAKIVDFLELKQEGMLKIEGRDDLAKDLPTWEHNKRLTRYSMRPLFKIGEKYYWAPHSVHRSAKVWLNATSSFRLPAEIPQAVNTSQVLLKGHRSIEESLVKKAKEIIERFTPYVQAEVQPHKIDSSIGDNRYGDYDVLAYLEDKNILLNVESKVIDSDYSLKDLQKTQRNTFFGRTRSDGSTEKADLQRVEDRAQYLSTAHQKIMSHFGWKVPSEPPKVVSIFVTRMGYWWMKAPPVKTDVKFVQIKLLNDFLKEI